MKALNVIDHDFNVRRIFNLSPFNLSSFFFFFLQYHRDITSFHYHWSFFTDRQRLWPTFFLLFHRKKRRIDKIAIWRFISRILVLIILPIEWSLLEQTKDAPDVFKRNPCFCNCNCKCRIEYTFDHIEMLFVRFRTIIFISSKRQHPWKLSFFRIIRYSTSLQKHLLKFSRLLLHICIYRTSLYPDHRYLTFNLFLLVINLFSFVEIN